MTERGFVNPQPIEDKLPNATILQEISNQNKLQRLTTYPYHLIMIAINLLQILNFIDCPNEIHYYDDIKKCGIDLHSILYYAILVFLSLIFSGVIVFMRPADPVASILQDYESDRKIIPEGTVQLLKRYYQRNGFLNRIFKCKDYTQLQLGLKISQCQDFSGVLNIETPFQKRHVQIFTTFETRLSHPDEENLVKEQYKQWLQAKNLGKRLKYDRQKDTECKFDWEYGQKKVGLSRYFEKEYLSRGKSCWLGLVVLLGAVFLLSYPVNFIVDKLFVQRFKLRLIKKININRAAHKNMEDEIKEKKTSTVESEIAEK